MKQFKVVIEKHSDGYVAYPVGIVGAVVGQGDTYEEALADVESAIACYIENLVKVILSVITGDLIHKHFPTFSIIRRR